MTTTWNDVRRIVDELQLEIHLAGMNARQRWSELQPKLVKLEHAVERGGATAGQAIADQISAIGKALRTLRLQVADEIAAAIETPKEPAPSKKATTVIDEQC